MSATHGESEDPARRLLGLMHQVGRIVGPSPEDFVDVELTMQQMRALFVIARHAPLSVTELAGMLDASLASTSSLVDRLVRTDYAQREPDPDDRRKVLLAPTPTGSQLAERLMSHALRRFGSVFGAMSPKGQASLEAGLTDLLRAADEAGIRPRPHHAAAGAHHGGRP